MAIVQSFGALQAMTDRNATGGVSGGSLSLYNANSQTYAAIYRTQPNVRTVIDFLARNIAQLGIHIFRRIDETDRERVVDHQLAGWLARPNPATTRYRLIEDLISDLGIYFNAYWLKVRNSDPLGGLIRLPASQMLVAGGLMPEEFVWSVRGKEKKFPASEVVYFNGYNPGGGDDNGLMGISPLETLRRVLAEEHAASQYREDFWHNAARMEGIWERSADAPNWTAEQVREWREQWQEFATSAKAGMTAVGPRGMTYKETSFSAKDAEFVAARKLSREECAAAFHVPLPMVGILEHATFSNIKEQHKHLYQDCLGPWLVMIQEEIERQLLVECADQKDIYVEFNIAAKLAGSFEEQASSLQTLVGAPVMTRNEGRAKLNLPRDPDPESDRLAPQQGGPASTQPAPDDAASSNTPADEDAAAHAVTNIIQATRARQRAKLAKVDEGQRAAVFAADLERWNRELADDLGGVTGADETARAAQVNADTLRDLETKAMQARVSALENKPAPKPVAMRRTFERNPENGLVTSFVDAPAEANL